MQLSVYILFRGQFKFNLIQYRFAASFPQNLKLRGCSSQIHSSKIIDNI